MLLRYLRTYIMDISKYFFPYFSTSLKYIQDKTLIAKKLGQKPICNILQKTTHSVSMINLTGEKLKTEYFFLDIFMFKNMYSFWQFTFSVIPKKKPSPFFLFL